jgi:hypothetical protein
VHASSVSDVVTLLNSSIEMQENISKCGDCFSVFVLRKRFQDRSNEVSDIDF